MPRTGRVEIVDGIHHVMSRGNRRQAIVIDDHDRRVFADEYERAVTRRGWHSLAWCLMGNHFHLLLQTPEPNLGDGMRGFLSRVAQRFNNRHELDGHLFKERYRAVHVANERHFACAMRYIALNPVNAGLCEDPAQWRWSSHAQMLAGRPGPLADVRRVEELLEGWGGPHGTRYRTLLAPDGQFGSWRDAVSPEPPRPSIDELLSSRSLDEAMTIARREHGYRLSEVAAAVGVSVSTVWRRTSG